MSVNIIDEKEYNEADVYSRAPVVVFLYNRPEHTERMFKCLEQCEGIEYTDVFIFCDGAKESACKQDVEKVRQIARDFQITSKSKSVSVKISDVNKGLANSVIEGVSTVIYEKKRVIVLEDDILVDKSFLKYMNEALEFYSSCSDIWSITGYSFNLKSLDNYKHDIYYSYRGCSWGWATWLDRWKLVDWNVASFNQERHSLRNILRFNRGGFDLYDMLVDQMEGRIDSWAIRWCYSQSKMNMFTVYPKNALVSNSGFDGTGTHNVTTDRFVSNMKVDQRIKLEELCINKKIAREFRRKYDGGIVYYLLSKFEDNLRQHIKNYLRKLGLRG